MSRTKLLPLIISMTLRRHAHKGGHTHDIAISCYLEDRGEVGSKCCLFPADIGYKQGTNKTSLAERGTTYRGMLHPGQQPGSGTRRHKHTTGVTQTGDVVHTCVACQHHPRTSRTNGLLTVTYPLRPQPLVPENLFRYRKIHFFLWKNSYKQESKVSSQKHHKHFWNSLKNLFYN